MIMTMVGAIPSRNKSLSPVRRRLLNTFGHSRHTNTLTTTTTASSEKARRLRWAVCLYFVLCISLSVLMFTWTMTATVDQNISPLDAAQGSFGLRNPFHRVAMSRSMLQVDSSNNNNNNRDEQPQQQQQQQGKASTLEQSASPQRLPKPAADVSVDHENVPIPESKEYRIISPATTTTNGVSEYLQIPDDEPVVQVVYSRFMQNQPHLIELGLARLELLKTLCLPTLQQQSSQNFLWIIRADPLLAAPVKYGLLKAIHDATAASPDFAVVVVGVDDNPNGFRRDLDTTADQVWTDNFALLKHYHEASQSRIVLETRLDADDGLHINFVELMQEEAVLYLDEDTNPNWLVWCAGTHVEWQYGTPWGDASLTQSSILLNGTELPPSSTSSSPPQQHEQQQPATTEDDSAFGSLLPGLTRGCITPGLTKGYGRTVNFEDMPEAQHHQLHFMIDHCNNDVDTPDWHQCLVIWQRLVPNAIRGRTPTSAGMQFVLGKHTSYLSNEAKDALGLEEIDYHSKQDMMWAAITRKFSITKESIAQMRTFLTKHMHGVAQDNLVGQCTKGHSCKNSTQIILKELMENTPTVRVQ